MTMSSLKSIALILAASLSLSACATAPQKPPYPDTQDQQAASAVPDVGNITLLSRALSAGQVDVYDPFATAFNIPAIPVDAKGIVFPQMQKHETLLVADDSVTVYGMDMIMASLNAYGEPLEPAPVDSAYIN